MVEKPDIVDAEFEVIDPGPERDTRPIWQRYTIEWNPWPLVGAIALGLPLLLNALSHP